MSELTYVIPVFNRAKLIERTILSLINQPGGSRNLIVVDDGSTDDTADVVSTYKDKLKLLRQPNLGPCAARNLGLQAVDSEIVCFIDSDDCVIGAHRMRIEEDWNN